MKKSHRFLAILLMGFCSISYAATFSGRVVNDAIPSVPVANALVILKTNGDTAVTGANGQFSFTLKSTHIASQNSKAFSAMQLAGANLVFSTMSKTPVRIELFDMRGTRITTLLDKSFEAGSYSLSLPMLMQSKHAAGLYTVKIQKGTDRVFATYIAMGAKGGMFANDRATGYSRGVKGFAKMTAAQDNLSVYRMGYVKKELPITSLETQALGDIVLTREASEVAIEKKIDSLLALMTINEKAGQMTQVQIWYNGSSDRLTDAQVASLGIGSVFNGGSDGAGGADNSPNTWATGIDRVQKAVMTNSHLKVPIIYGQDCVHGVGSIAGCTVFPHNIGLGCSGDTGLVSKIGQVTAQECAGVGIRLNFAPCVASVRNERWGRSYEGFGELPEINALLGAAYTRGLQGAGDMTKNWAVAASVKHYLGDGANEDGANPGSCSLSETTMRAIHLPQYAACARENMATVMPSYSTWIHNGGNWKQSFDSVSLKTILKGDLGFDGFCVSDWDAIKQACSSNDYSNACVSQSINAGMDMAMVCYNVNPSVYINAVVACVNNKTISQSRIDDAVRRILRVKFRLNLFANPYSNSTLRSEIYSQSHKDLARESVRKSLVLLKNDANALPLLKTEKVVVVGSSANNMGKQCGGWTIAWQGDTTSKAIAGQTISAGLKEVGGTNVTYDAQGNNISSADKIVCVVSERPYAEGEGDAEIAVGKSANLVDRCPEGSLIQKCVASGKPVVLVMITGRPLIFTTPVTSCKAIVAAWLPGSEGGGIADVLYKVNNYNFTGKLTHTWPASVGQIPINAGPVYADEKKGSGGTPQFDYGFGLKY